LKVLQLLPEPTAACISYLLENDVEYLDCGFIVFDLGGGTFDVTFIDTLTGALNVRGIEGNSRCGGEDIDEVLLFRLVEVIWKDRSVSISRDDPRHSAARQKLNLAVREAKERLSTQDSV